MCNQKFVNHIAGGIFLAALAFCGSIPVQAQQRADASFPSVTSVRVMTYNIHHGRGGDDNVDLTRIAEVIKAARPDIVALQEVDDKTLRTGRIDQTAELARLVGMTGKFVHQIDYEGGRYGQAILSKFPISNLEVNWLPGVPDRQRRIAGSVTIDLGSQKLLFITTHLHHADDAIRQLQAEQLNTIFASAESGNQTVVLAGDLNATPQSETLRVLSGRWMSATAGRSDTLTYPASSPVSQLDYVLYLPWEKVEVIASEVNDEADASDHRPLVVELLLKQ
jgi:endonuclease/exonuclease/phosphatase family metal-dependent hydrolase